MRRLSWTLVTVLFAATVLFATSGLAAAAAPCDRLNGASQQLVQQLLRSTYPYACCDETLERCLRAKPVCRLAERLRDEICRRASHGQTAAKIKSALEQRARSMLPMGKPATFDLSNTTPAGPAGAPVQVVAYACTRCPFCRIVLSELHRLVTTGTLKGKVALYLRPFPISRHAGAVEGGLALIAAERLKRFWPYLLKLYSNFERFATNKLPEWAAELGLDRQVFAKELASSANRQALVAIKKEGLRNGVEATPALYINGRKYYGELDSVTLLDVLEEELERVRKR